MSIFKLSGAYQNVSTAVVLYCFVEPFFPPDLKSVVYTCEKFSAHGAVSSYVGFQNIVIIAALPRVRWHRANSPQGSSSNGCCLCITMDQMLLCSSLFPHPLLVCVCVFFPFILDIKFVGRTSRGHTGGRSHKISHLPSFCGACLNFSREKDSAIPFSRRL